MVKSVKLELFQNKQNGGFKESESECYLATNTCTTTVINCELTFFNANDVECQIGQVIRFLIGITPASSLTTNKTSGICMVALTECNNTNYWVYSCLNKHQTVFGSLYAHILEAE